MRYDVVVVGGGHAGVEAAASAARGGLRTLLLALRRDTVGAMSCNPAIGGIGKGHLVREIDVFDGVIPRAADAAAIHYRMLNTSKGLAVRGPRVQADRTLFRAAVERRLAEFPMLDIGEGEVVSLQVRGGQVAGVTLAEGATLDAKHVVLATGTFLGGRLFRGRERTIGGRIAEPAAHRLADQVRDFGLRTARLKTGTPPRLHGRSIDWSRLERQTSDQLEWTMAPRNGGRINPQLFCAVTRTSERTHNVLRAAADRSPLYAGAIEGRGPRYCPSIEDKVKRFGDRDGHQIFLEPETLSGDVIYPNGISTSMPVEVQEEFVRTIAGLEKCCIAVPGYAVEYDHVDPRQLDHSLQTDVKGLRLAGQINGTTGYEEAAAQGLVAGLAVVADMRGGEPARFSRADSYIGVMIDDLVLAGVDEPYRMLTARSEFRLSLRADNAVDRLYDAAVASGLVGDAAQKRMSDWIDDKQAFRQTGSTHDAAVAESVGADELYAPYVARQANEFARSGMQAVAIARDFDFGAVAGLSAEMTERLARARPASTADAARIPGVTPAAVTALMVAVRKYAA